MARASIAVIGSLMVDHIVILERPPEPDEIYPAKDYHKVLGGKGANLAIAAYRTCHKKPQFAEEWRSVALGGAATHTGLTDRTVGRGSAPILRRGATDDTTTSGPMTNAAAANNKLNIDVRMIGPVGEDENAELIREALANEGIDVSGVRTIQGQVTALAFVTYPEGMANWILVVMGALDAVTPADFLKVEDFGKVRPDLIVVQSEISTKTIEQILQTAGKANIDVVLNAAPARSILLDYYKYITHLIVNKNELAVLSGVDLEDVKEENWPSMAQDLLDEGIRNVVITLGDDGAFFANERISGHVSRFRVERISPTGAGDTFIGTYVAECTRQNRMQEKFDIEKAVTRAAKAAALVAGTLIAQEGIPWADELDSFFVNEDSAIALEP